MDQEKRSIEFTKDQFLALMKAVYLGNWMANAQLLPDKKRADIEAIEDLVFSMAKDFGFGRYVENETTDDSRYYPTRYFEEETGVEEIVAEYDEETFWDEITDRLGERDFMQRYGEQTVQRMSRDERFDKISKCIDRWGEEFETNGIERLVLRDDA